MNPNDGSRSGGSPNPRTPQEEQSAAANVLRSQISALYGDRPAVTPAPRDQQDSNPYERTHQQNPPPQADQWKAYHSAWQNYYQQYYEAFYAHQQKKQTVAAPTEQHAPTEQVASSDASSQTQSPAGFFSQHTDIEETAEDLSKDQALYELRQKLLGRVRHQAKKVRTSKHFVPIAAAVAVVLVFVFLQYNSVLMATVNAYVSPGAIDPQNIVIDPTGSSNVGPDPRLIIPKINVDVPAIYGIGSDYTSQMAAMQNGVAHFAIPGANSHPGEVGNTVLSGHSSNDLFDPGDYKFIFAQLDKLAIGDTIYANYQGKRYTYVISKTEIVKPTEVNKLVYPTTKPVLTLITCTPLGTSRNRLLITAEQVSPDPAGAATAPAGSGTTSGDSTELPGNGSTLLEKLFGAQ
ncbi:MAG: sortase [Candidatus Saccharimonadaceae bacterium]